jgi:hypothetical protein
MRFDHDASDGPELVLRDAPGSDQPPHRRGGGVLTGVVLLAVLACALALGFYGRGWWMASQEAGPASPAPNPAAAAAAASVPAEFGPVPPLDASDAFVRALVRQLSQKPEWATWLASDNLVRAFVVAVDKVAVGSSPAKELKAAAPTTRFATTGSGRTLRIDPAGYERYNAVANAVDAIDPEGAARAYRRLRPLLQEAFDELGYVNLSFDERFARALGLLVDVPVQEGDVPLRPTSVTFQFADPDLEALAPAQKHLLRMGPHNMRLVQNKIRAFARAAGLTQTGT